MMDYKLTSTTDLSTTVWGEELSVSTPEAFGDTKEEGRGAVS